MAQQTTFNTPNYLGELHLIAPAEAPFYTMIGGKAAVTKSKDFSWQTGSRSDTPSQASVALEGATPTASGNTRGEISNVCQIVQESFEVTYTKMAATGNLDGLAILGDQPVQDEKTYQAMMKLAKIKEDLEWSFLNGVYAKPADNNTARQTRGVLTAITSNVVTASDAVITGVGATASTDVLDKTAHGLTTNDEIEITVIGGGAAGLALSTSYWVIASGLTADAFKVSTSLGGSTVNITTDSSGGGLTIKKRNPASKAQFDKLLRTMVGNKAPMSGLVIMANAFNKQQISSIYGYAPQDRNVGGLNIQQLETDFATLGIVYNRHIKADTVAVIDVGACRPRVLPIPGKGFLFEEMLGQVGSAEKYQIYGEIGLEYGWEGFHGKITGLTSDEVVA